MENWEVQLNDVLKQVSALMQEAEEIIRENGVDTPKEQPRLPPHNKIQFPKGYIRRIRHFEEKYALNTLAGEEAGRNIAYALQLSDVFNYFFNRFNIGLSAGSLLYKYGLINIMSIIESMLYGCYIRLREWCIDDKERICEDSGKCSFYLTSTNKLNFRKLVSALQSKELMTLSTEQEELLFQLKHLRDNVHSWKVSDNEFHSDLYNLGAYNQAIRLLEEVSGQLRESVVRYSELRRNQYQCFNFAVQVPF